MSHIIKNGHFNGIIINFTQKSLPCKEGKIKTMEVVVGTSIEAKPTSTPELGAVSKI